VFPEEDHLPGAAVSRYHTRVWEGQDLRSGSNLGTGLACGHEELCGCCLPSPGSNPLLTERFTSARKSPFLLGPNTCTGSDSFFITQSPRQEKGLLCAHGSAQMALVWPHAAFISTDGILSPKWESMDSCQWPPNKMPFVNAESSLQIMTVHGEVKELGDVYLY
jgi:hypothetical protein